MILPSILKEKKKNDIFNVCQFLLQNNQVKFTDNVLFEKIESHVECPSLLALKDTLAAYGIESATIRKGDYRYADFETPIYLAACGVLIASIYILMNYHAAYSWLALSFLLTSFLGLGISTLLVWNEVDAHNPFLKEVCGGQGKKMNCDAVLSSAQSSFLGISWLVWSFSFMATLFLVQLFFANQIPFLLVSVLLSLVAAPYIFFSLYYQWKIVKQWCPLCLGVQDVLLINSLLTTGFLVLHTESIEVVAVYPVLVTAAMGVILLATTYNLLPVLKKARDSKNYDWKRKQLHYNADIFGYLSNKPEQITYPVDNLGIVVGNPNATNEIVKVCNPYCGLCSKAHPDVSVRILFTATGEENDIRTAPVSHLLAIKQKHGKETVHG